MACERFIIWMLFVFVFFGVFIEGVPIDEAHPTTNTDISNSGIAFESIYEKEVGGFPSPTISLLSLLRGDGNTEYSDGVVNVEQSNALSSSDLKSKQSKTATDNDENAEKDSILKHTNSIPMTFKESDIIEVADKTVSYDEIVRIGPDNYDIETANINIFNTRSKRETETTESSKEDEVDVDWSSLMNNMNTVGPDENNVPDIGRQIFVNKVVFRVQLQMEYDTDNIPPDIKTDETLESPKRSPTEEVDRSETQKDVGVTVTSAENITKLMLEGDIDKSIVEYSTAYTISSRDIHNEEITTNTEKNLDKSSRTVGRSRPIKISLRSSFDDDFPTASDENATDTSADATDEVNINESSIMDSVTDTPQHNSFPGPGSRDITPDVGVAEAVLDKRLERFMLMEMGLGMVIIISCVTTVIQIIVIVKKLKGIRNTYECTAVP